MNNNPLDLIHFEAASTGLNIWDYGTMVVEFYESGVFLSKRPGKVQDGQISWKNIPNTEFLLLMG